MPVANALLRISQPDESGFVYRYVKGNPAIFADSLRRTPIIGQQRTIPVDYKAIRNVGSFNVPLADAFGKDASGYLVSGTFPYKLAIKIQSPESAVVYYTWTLQVMSASLSSSNSKTAITKESATMTLQVTRSTSYSARDGFQSISRVDRSPQFNVLLGGSVDEDRPNTTFSDAAFFGGNVTLNRLDVDEAQNFTVWADIDDDSATTGLLTLGESEGLASATYDLTCVVRYNAQIKPRMKATYRGIEYTIARVETISLNRYMRLTLTHDVT